MNQRLKSVLLFVFDLRSVIVAFAVFNFALVWREAQQCMDSAVVPAGYCPWRYNYEPIILLAAALLLRTDRWWGNVVALILGGYLIGYFLYLLSIIDDPWERLRATWETSRVDYPYLVGSWDSQYVFALLILCCSGFFLARGILRWRASHSHGG